MNPLRKRCSEEDLRTAYEELWQSHPVLPQNMKTSSTGLSESAIQLTKPTTPVDDICLAIEAVWAVEIKSQEASTPHLVIINKLLEVALEWEMLDENVLAVGWKDILLTT